jgi:hypothetical protein
MINTIRISDARIAPVRTVRHPVRKSKLLDSGCYEIFSRVSPTFRRVSMVKHERANGQGDEDGRHQETLTACGELGAEYGSQLRPERQCERDCLVSPVFGI